MKGDFSKDTFRKKKHFHDVHMQQGRVMLDSDWNEQADIYEHRVETETLDVVGKAGAPYHDAGFDIVTVDNAGNPVVPPTAGVNIKISAGRMYVDGIMCENEEAVLFVNQPDYDKTDLPKVAGRYVFYLDVWQRHITALEDEELREVALGGPDTTTRNKTIWQVKCEPVKAGTTCADLLPAKITDAPTGKLMARTELPSGTEDPCGLAVSGGYRRLENQLYRVEIHKGAASRAATTFKWSRDNGSVVVKWDSVEVSNPDNYVVSSGGRDELLGFKSGDWIEMIDDRTDLLGLRGPMVQLSKADGNILTINPATNIAGDVTVTAGTKNARIRRWDSAGELKPNTNNTDWIELEDGVQVQFREGSFRTGDYWLIPARTATADIEWPFTDPQSPQGIQHHYAKLGIADLVIGANPGWVKIGDCRLIFPPLTELITLNYVGGDGQEAIPGNFLDEELKVAVSNGQWPVKDAIVRFKIDSGGGTLGLANASTVTVLTDNAGIAICKWKLGPAKTPLDDQRVVVNLLDAGGNIIHLPVIFSAKLMRPALFYVSGDGQGAMPGKDLPAPLKVGVSYDQFAVANAKVKFTVSGGGSILPANASTTGVSTGADGIASCTWKLGVSGVQQVTAVLLDDANNPIHIPIIFNASLNVADNIAFDSSDCDNWATPKPDNVADALIDLCKRKSGQSCCYTINPDGNGDFKTLLEAIEKLTKKKEKNVCLCLMPGQHLVDENILMIQKKMSFNSLKISGCTSNIVMKAQRIELVAEKLMLEGFQLNANPENKNEDDSNIVLSAAEINMNYCAWFKGGVSKLPFIAVDKESLVYMKNNKIIAWYSLALTDGVQGILESNLISYLLLQNSNRLPFDPLPFTWKNTDEKKQRSNMKIKNTEWSLTIRSNRIGAIVTNVEKDATHNLYQDMYISENIIQFPANNFLAKFLHVINNQFLYEDINKLPATLAFVLGINIIAIGNSGVGTRAAGGPANLLGTIDAIVLNLIRGNGTGAAQTLNLVNVEV